MNIGVPRALIVTLAAVFSAYHLVLALYSIGIPTSPAPVVGAMIIYAVATIVSLSPRGPSRMPIWMAAYNVAVVVALPLLVTHELDPAAKNGYATWYVAAIGTLMTITSIRRRHTFAWVGVGFLVVQSIVWAGPASLVNIGVIGSVSWVAVSHILSSGMAKATRDAQRFTMAEREATEWQAAQEAHVSERQLRLGKTNAMALDMLKVILAMSGRLSDADRQECLYLEGAIRDEIRGRRLLNDAVRTEVMNARRRGATVSLLDEGGLDDLGADDLERVHNSMADAIRGTTADKIIARTVQEGSGTAVTIVGLTTLDDGSAGLLGYGDDDDEDEVDLWVEIPRTLA